jgi:hypothetical protein
MAKLKSELTTDFSRGMLDDLAATRYPSNVAREIINGRIQPDGTVRRRPGSERLHAAALVTDGIGYGGIEFITAAGQKQIVVFINDEAHYSTDGGANWTQIDTGLREDYYSLAIMRVGAVNYLYAANGDTTVKRWDGTTWDTNPNAPSGVKFLAVFHGRLWYAGHSGVEVKGSQIANPAVVATPYGTTVQINTHDGSDVPTGLYQLGAHLLVFDANSTSYIDGYGEQTLLLAQGAEGFSRSVGCIAFRTIVGVGENAICWLSKRGIEYYATGSGIRLLTSPGLQTFFETLNRPAIEETPGLASACYDAVTQEYHVALSTTGVRNDRIVVINLLQRGRDWLGAHEVDEPQATTAPPDEILFDDAAADAEGYLQEDAVSGVRLDVDEDGYAEFGADASDGLPTEEDAEGYLSSAITEEVGASLFIAEDDERGSAVHSVGYDGFVRKHQGWGDNDDVTSTGTGGVVVEMQVVTRPFLQGSVRHRKRTRVIHIASIQDNASEVTVSVRANGAGFPTQTLAMPATTFDQPKRKKAMVKADGDEPQVVLTTEDDVRVAVLGVSAELLREPV